MDPSDCEARSPAPDINAAEGQGAERQGDNSEIGCLCGQLEQIDGELAKLKMPEEEHDAAIARRVAELMERRKALFHQAVCLPRLLPNELPQLLQSVIDQLKAGGVFSCRDSGDAEATLKGLQRVAGGLRKICSSGHTRRWIKAAAEREVRHQTWHGDETLIVNQSSIDPDSGSFLISAVSDAFCDVLGYTPEECIGKPVSAYMTPGTRERYHRLAADFKRTGMIRNVPYEFLTKSGVARPVTANCLGEFGTNGEVVRGYAVTRLVQRG